VITSHFIRLITSGNENHNENEHLTTNRKKRRTSRMAQPAIERSPSIPWNSNPLFFIRDLIANDPKLSPRGRSHVLLVCNKIIAMNTGDVRQEGLSAGAVYSYARWARLTETSAQATKDSAKEATREAEAARALDHYGKCLRIASLTGKAKKRSRAKMFTAPTSTPAREARAMSLSGTPLATALDDAVEPDESDA
jgi:hypothetical protein